MALALTEAQEVVQQLIRVRPRAAHPEHYRFEAWSPAPRAAIRAGGKQFETEDRAGVSPDRTKVAGDDDLLPPSWTASSWTSPV